MRARKPSSRGAASSTKTKDPQIRSEIKMKTFWRDYLESIANWLVEIGENFNRNVILHNALLSVNRPVIRWRR